MSYQQGHYPTRNFPQQYPQHQGGYPQQGYPPQHMQQMQQGGYPPQHAQHSGYSQPKPQRMNSRMDRSYDNSMMNDSMQSQSHMPLHGGKHKDHKDHGKDKTKKKIEELKQRVQQVDNFTCLNWCGVCVAVSAIISGLIFVIVALVATSTFQNVGCGSSDSLVSTFSNAVSTTTNNVNSDDPDVTDAVNSLNNAVENLNDVCNGAGNTIKGILIGIGVTIVVLETIIIFGHCIGNSAFKNFDASKMSCAHTFYVIFLILGIITANLCWCVIYYMLMSKAGQIRDLLREIEALKAKR